MAQHATFHERRKEQKPVESSNRRRLERRQLLQLVTPERRRLLTQGFMQGLRQERASYKNDRRSYRRVREVLLINLIFRDRLTRNRKIFKGYACTIGLGGLSILTEQALPRIDKGIIEINLPAPLNPVKARVKVKWIDGERHYCGITFINSSNNYLDDWEKFLKASGSPSPDRRQKERERRSDSNTTHNLSNLEKRKILRRMTDLWEMGIYNDREKSSITRADLFPKQRGKDYTLEAVKTRREWLSFKTGVSLKHIGIFSEDPQNMQGNIENLIGVAQIPIGIAGPLKVNGQFAKGIFYIPMAVTEGTLVYSCTQGMHLISLAGGATTALLKDEIHISPVFVFDSVKVAQQFVRWLDSNFARIKEEAERTTRHGKLIRLEPYVFDKNVAVKFCYTTGDAMGINMITFCTEEACKLIVSTVKPRKFYLQSNFSSIKKVTSHNFITGFGKSVVSEVVIPGSFIKRAVGIAPEDIVEFYQLVQLTTTHAGMIGISAHTANALAAVFLACGQDVACIVDSYIGVTNFELTEDKSLYVSVKLPCLLVGTVGGGTGLATQRECLSLLGCYGDGQSKKFSEIIAATVLAGEIGTCATIASGTFADAHRKYSKDHGKT